MMLESGVFAETTVDYPALALQRRRRDLQSEVAPFIPQQETPMKWKPRKKQIQVRGVRVRLDDISPGRSGTSTPAPEQSARLRSVWDVLQRFPGLPLPA